MRKIITVVVFLITVIGYTQDKEFNKEYDGYKYIETEEDGKELYYKIAKEGYVWYKIILPEEKEFDGYEGKVKTQVTLQKIDCESETIGEKALVLYDKSNKVLYEEQLNFFQIEMKMPTPNSYSEFYMNFYCEKTYLVEHYKKGD
ncbi:hypothetical protein [Polaribacter sp.]|uniref:hypothetical protein n=1 Tax=Polaribacter sp. TaxID=1920175 RepID=UPI0025FE06FB|nr:hypothetical protein [Polaribacter sp.]